MRQPDDTLPQAERTVRESEARVSLLGNLIDDLDFVGQRDAARLARELQAMLLQSLHLARAQLNFERLLEGRRMGWD